MIQYAALAGIQLAGGYFAAQNMRESARLNQEIADMNAEFAELDAFDAQAEGQSEQARYDSVIKQTMGEQQTILAAQGVDASYGTNAALAEENKFIGEMNLLEIKKHAEEKALGYKTQAREFRTQGAMQRADADSKAATVKFNSMMSAAQTGLTGYKAAGSPSFWTEDMMGKEKYDKMMSENNSAKGWWE
jgi:hypothetical protein